MRAQGYDGAANMAGIHRGVQAIIRHRVPDAVFVHCKAHSLNLAIGHACREPFVRNMLGTLQQIAFAFHYSAKRLLAFQECLSQDAAVRVEMERHAKLRTLCETRWASRADSLYTFRTAFPVVVQSLAEGGDAKARGYASSILQFDFIIALCATEHVLSNTVALSTMLQGQSINLFEAAKESKVVISVLREERNDQVVWSELFERAKELAAGCEIEPSVPRISAIQRNRVNVPAVTPQQYWYRALYLPLVDHLIQELNDRLLNHNDRFLGQYLIPTQLGSLNRETTNKIYNAYSNDLSNRAAFDNEIVRWKARWVLAEGEKPNNLEHTLSCTSEDLYPSVATVLTILLNMPVSTATPERSFSTMRRVKTYVRSTMLTERLSSLPPMHAYREMPIDPERVISDFCASKPRRLAFE